MGVGAGAICLCCALVVRSLANVLRTGSLVAHESGAVGWDGAAPSLAINELLRFRDGFAGWYLGTANVPSLGVGGEAYGANMDWPWAS